MADEWHIRVDKRYLDPAAGSGARAMEQELAAGKGNVRRLLETVLDVPTADRNWRRGAEGEEKVAARLAKKLNDRWVVIHDLTIGTKGANLDHLVIGPAGVFTLNTKHLKGKITVYDKAVLHNGQNHGFLPKARNEAKKVAQRLAEATGAPADVRPVIVLTGPAEADIKGSPRDVRVIGYLRLAKWLQGLPEVTPAGEVLRLERAARDPETWSPPRRTKRSAAAPAGPDADVVVVSTPRPPVAAPSTPPPPRPAVASAAPAAGPAEVNVSRWKRYGMDRFYANATTDGTKLGYIEVATGELVLDTADEAGTVAARLRAARDALGSGA